MSNKNIYSSQSKLDHAKNLARGALATLKTETITVDRRGDRAPVKHSSTWINRQNSTYQLNKAIEVARKSLSQSEQRMFNQWLSKIAPALDPEFSSLGAPHASLGIFPQDITIGKLGDELKASILRIQKDETEISLFAQLAKQVSEDIGQQSYDSAIELLNSAADRYGSSFWYVESYLAVTHFRHGVERLKAGVEKFSAGAGGQQKFLYYYFGIRNEPSQNSARFRSMLRKIIDDGGISDPLNVYLKYRLYGAMEIKEQTLASILALEQTTSTIDLFFTLQRVVGLILSKSNIFTDEIVFLARKTESLLEPALRTLSDLDDEQISSSIAVQALNVLFDSTHSEVAHCTDQQAVLAVSAQLSTSGDQLRTDETSKALINTSWLPVAQAVGEIHDIPSLPELIYSEDVLTTPFVETLKRTLMQADIRLFSGAAVDAIQILRKVQDLVASNELSQAAELLAASLRDMDNENLADALEVFLAHTLIELGDLHGAVAVCARAGRNNERLASHLPLARLFVGKRWKSLSTLGPSTDLAIALGHASRTVDDSKLKTFKRYAVEELLVKYSAMTVAELIDKLKELTHPDELWYFGYVVCDIPTIELLPGMGESRLVRHTRAALLHNLAQLKIAESEQLENEAQELEDALQVDDGLYILDDSKVHVDEQAVVDFALEEYQADFQRYKKLTEADVKPTESLPELLKALGDQPARIFQMPKSDADELLVQLIGNILQRFLYDPASGLDIIIGRRIRHNTISSELRGVLEKEDLIGTIHHGKYQTPVRITKACVSMDVRRRKVISAASVRFSDSIDQLIALLRDHYFNVRSRSKPRGVFEIVINSIAYAWIKTSAQFCENLADFTRECIHAFWLFLSGKLDVVRPDVEAEMKRSLKHAFQRFSAELVSQGADLALISGVQRASDELQRRATTIASWISIPKVRLGSHRYSMGKTVDIAVAVVLGEAAAFKPTVAKEIDETIMLDQRDFVIVSDALYVALHNVAKHSGKKSENKILIKATSVQAELCFEITNDIGPSARKPEKQNRLDIIRRDIQRRAIADGARKNKHSGLKKLAALVDPTSVRSLEFGFVGKDRFSLYFRLPYTSIISGDSL